METMYHLPVVVAFLVNPQDIPPARLIAAEKKRATKASKLTLDSQETMQNHGGLLLSAGEAANATLTELHKQGMLLDSASLDLDLVEDRKALTEILVVRVGQFDLARYQQALSGKPFLLTMAATSHKGLSQRQDVGYIALNASQEDARLYAHYVPWQGEFLDLCTFSILVPEQVW